MPKKKPPAGPAGATNKPGGDWYSTPDAQRHRKPRRVTAEQSTWDAIDAHVPEGERSKWIEEAVLARLRSEGVKV